MAVRILLEYGLCGCQSLPAVGVAVQAATVRGGLTALVFLALVCRVRFPSPCGMAQALLAGRLMQTLFLGGCFYAMSRGLPAAVTALITGLQPVLAPGLNGNGLDGWGSMAACMALLGVTTGTLYQKQLPADGHVFASTFFQYVAVSLVMGLVCLFDHSASVQWHSTFVFGLLCMVFGVSVTAVMLLTYLIRRGEATRVATYYLVPALTALIVLGMLLVLS